MIEKRFNEIDGELAVRLIDEKSFTELREIICHREPRDIALLFEDVPQKYRTALFRLLPKEYAADSFVELDTDVQRELVESFTEGELRGVIDELFLDDAVDIIEEMPANVVKKILRASSATDRQKINQLLGYPKDSAGSLMTPEYVRLLPDMTASEALAHIRRVALDSETIYTCYVTDGKRRLIGIVTAKQLLISDPETKISQIMNTAPIYAETNTDKETVLNVIREYGFLALPVVDNEQRLVGIVTVDDAVDAMSEEAEADFAKMAAITPGDEEYLKTSVFSIFRARIPWLLLLLISSALSSLMLTRFESALPAVLVLFVPMLMGTGGNCGSQASVTVIRSLSLGTVSPKNTPRVLTKELLVGILCAVTLGVAAFLKVLFVDGAAFGNASVTIEVALAVAIALASVVIVSKLIGAALPIIVKVIGLDPAVMASPFITTIVDALSLVVYFTVANIALA